eukprot:508430-Pleurochrysis_carterae.AAC.1
MQSCATRIIAARDPSCEMLQTPKHNDQWWCARVVGAANCVRAVQQSWWMACILLWHACEN